MSPITANVQCPPDSLDARGQPRGHDGVLMRDVPLLKLKTIGGSEPDVGGQQQSVSIYRFEIEWNPEIRLKPSDYFTGGSLGPRQLNIQQIIDESQNNQHLTIICGERHEP